MAGDAGAASAPAESRQGHDRYQPHPAIRRPAAVFHLLASPRDLPNEAFRRGLWIFLAGLALTGAGGVVPGADREPRHRVGARSRLAPLRGRAAEGFDSRIEPSRPQRHVGRAGRGAAELHLRIEPHRRAENLRGPAASTGQRDVDADRERLEEREFPQPDHRRDFAVLRADQDLGPRYLAESALGADLRASCCTSLRPTRPSTVHSRFPRAKCCWTGRSTETARTRSSGWSGASAKDRR